MRRRNLAHMPETVAAAEAGDLSKAKVELLARARKERLADEFDRMEPTLGGRGEATQR